MKIDSRWKRLIKLSILSIIFISIISFVIYLKSESFEKWLEDLVVSNLKEAFKSDVDVGRLELRLFPPSIYFENLRIKNDSKKTPFYLKIPELEIQLSILHDPGRITLSRFILRRPSLILSLEKEEKRVEVVKDLLGEKGMARYLERVKPLPTPFMNLIRFGLFKVIEGEFLVELSPKGASVEGKRVTVNLQGISNLLNGSFSISNLSFHLEGDSYLLENIIGRLSTNFSVLRVFNLEFMSGDSIFKGKGELRIKDKGNLENLTYYSKFYLKLGESLLKSSMGLPVKVGGIVELTGEIQGTGKSAVIDGVVKGKDVTIDRFRVGGIEGKLKTDLSTLTLNDLNVRVDGGSVNIDANFSFKGEDRFEGSVLLHEIELANILENLTIENSHVMLLTSGRVNFIGQFDPFKIHGEVDLKEKDLAVFSEGFRRASKKDFVFGLPEARVKGRIEIDRDKVKIVHAEVYGKKTHARVKGFVGFDRYLDLQVSSPMITLSDMSFIRDLRMGGIGVGRVRVIGPFSKIEVTGDVDVKNYRILKYYPGDIKARVGFSDNRFLSFKNIEGLRGNASYRGELTFDFNDPITIYAKVSFDDTTIDDLLYVNPSISGLKLHGILSGNGEVSGVINRPGIRFSGRLKGGSLYGRGFDEMKISVGSDDESIRIENLDILTSNEGGFFIKGDVGRDGKLDIKMNGDGISLRELLSIEEFVSIDGVVRVSGRVGGSIWDLRPSLDFVLEDLTFGKEKWGKAEINVKSSDDYIEVVGRTDNGSINISGGLLKEGQFPITLKTKVRNLDLASLISRLSSESFGLKIIVSGEVTVDGNIKNISSLLTEFRGGNLLFDFKGNQLVNRTPVILSMREKNIYIEPVRFEHTGGSGASFSIGGVIDNEEGIFLSCEGSFPLSPLKNLVDGVFNTIDGSVDARFNITGPPEGLKFFGIGELKDGSISLKEFPPKIENITGSFDFSQDKVEIKGLKGVLGGGNISANGVIGFKDFKPARYDLTAIAKGVTMRFPDYLPMYNADGEVKFTGEVPNLTLSGDMTLNRWVYTDRINWKKEALQFGKKDIYGITIKNQEESPPPLFGIDIRVRAPEGRTIGIKNNMADIMLNGELRITGDTNRVGLTGEIESDDGEIVFHGNKYKLSNAIITFDDPYSFDPLIDLSLFSEIGDYKVYSDISGRLSNYHVHLSSDDPTLSEQDLNALVLFGAPISSLEESSQVGGMGLEAANIFMEKFFSIEDRFGGKLEKLPGWARIDRFQITSSYSDLSSAMTLKVMAEKELIEDRLYADGYTNITGTPGEDSRIVLEYKLSKDFSILSSWETEEDYRELGIGDFGIDFKFKFELE